MHSKDPLFVIGAFENPHFCPFPTHIQPVLARQEGNKFRRIFIEPSAGGFDVHSVHHQAEDLEEILKYSNFIKCEPIPTQLGDQYVYLGKNQIFATRHRTQLLFRLMPHLFSKRAKLAIRTMLNSLN